VSGAPLLWQIQETIRVIPDRWEPFSVTWLLPTGYFLKGFSSKTGVQYEGNLQVSKTQEFHNT